MPDAPLAPVPSEIFDQFIRQGPISPEELGFDDKILAPYARGMTVREIQGFLADMHGTEVSPDLISTATDGIVAEVTASPTRPSSACIRSRSVLRVSALYEGRFTKPAV